ncbi:hypothetical protein NPIL_660101 [Nephila pilipes]|uniref:Uncharacterized protein n=1 Tax=Nephila pilipes TaxID=299642 RepID=A0A8X6JNQ5_NEPPI|nr:hypothetical protein NPIL_660101 [Nephila pilipes]
MVKLDENATAIQKSGDCVFEYYVDGRSIGEYRAAEVAAPSGGHLGRCDRLGFRQPMLQRLWGRTENTFRESGKKERKKKKERKETVLGKYSLCDFRRRNIKMNFGNLLLGKLSTGVSDNCSTYRSDETEMNH